MTFNNCRCSSYLIQQPNSNTTKNKTHWRHDLKFKNRFKIQGPSVILVNFIKLSTKYKPISKSNKFR